MAAHPIPTPPASLDAPFRGRPASWPVRLVFIAAAVALATWGFLNGPQYHEWRLSHLSLAGLQQEVQKHPTDVLAVYYAAVRLNAMGQFKQADPMLRYACDVEPGNPRYRDAWAQALLGSGRVTAAHAELFEFVKRQPKSSRAHFLLGKFYLTENSMAHARDEMQTVLKLDPNNADAWGFLAAAQEAMGHWWDAVTAARRAVALRPGRATDHLRIAMALTNTDQMQDAPAEFEKAIQLSPRSGVIHREYARMLLAGGPSAAVTRAAELQARKALDLLPRDGDSELILGRALLAERRFSDAIPELTTASLLEPYNPNPPKFLTMAYHSLGNGAEATRWQQITRDREQLATREGHLKTILNGHHVSEVDTRAVHRELARIYGRTGEVERCLEQEALARHAAVDEPLALAAAADDLTGGGHPAAAMPLAKQAVEMSGNSPAIHETVGNVLLALGEIDQAGKEYNTAASWRPEWTARLKKKIDDAIRQRELHPPPAELAYRQARSMEESMVGPRRMTDQVEQLARRAVELEPANPNYLWYLLEVQMARKENDAAIATGSQLLQVSPKDPRAHAMLGVLLVDRASTPAELKVVESHLAAAANEPIVAPTRVYALGLLALKRKQPRLAVEDLQEAIRLDPNADVAYYKLALADKMAGDRAASTAALNEFQRRQNQKRSEMTALGDIAHHPDEKGLYERAAKLFDEHGLSAEASAIRAAEHRRFSRTTPVKTGGASDGRAAS